LEKYKTFLFLKSVSDLDPYLDPDPHGRPGSRSALEMLILDPDPAAIKRQQNSKIINICCWISSTNYVGLNRLNFCISSLEEKKCKKNS